MQNISKQKKIIKNNEKFDIRVEKTTLHTFKLNFNIAQIKLQISNTYSYRMIKLYKFSLI